MPEKKFENGHYNTVHDAISDLEDVPPVYDLAEDEKGIPLKHKDQLSPIARQLRDSSILKNHITTKTTDVAMRRFKALRQGENFHSLQDALKTNTTLAELHLRCEQRDHKEAQQESKASTMARGVAGQ